MLKQIRREKVTDAELATDEVIAPGKSKRTRIACQRLWRPSRTHGARAGCGRRRGPPGAAAVHDRQLRHRCGNVDAPEANTTVSQARATLIRRRPTPSARSILGHNTIAKKDVLSADSALAQSQAALDQALAAREQAERRLSVLGLSPRDFKQQVTVRSPLPGKVLDEGARRRARTPTIPARR